MAETNFVVHANVRWADTGIVLSESDTLTITYQSGEWTANPATSMVGPEGNSRLVAKANYSLPGGLEGQLVAMVGAEVVPVGSQATISNCSGRVLLSINDDLYQFYGKGFLDNQGSLTVLLQLS